MRIILPKDNTYKGVSFGPMCPSTDSHWESIEAIHGPLYATLEEARSAQEAENYDWITHCGEMGIHGDERTAYEERLRRRHEKSDILNLIQINPYPKGKE